MSLSKGIQSLIQHFFPGEDVIDILPFQCIHLYSIQDDFYLQGHFVLRFLSDTFKIDQHFDIYISKIEIDDFIQDINQVIKDISHGCIPICIELRGEKSQLHISIQRDLISIMNNRNCFECNLENVLLNINRIVLLLETIAMPFKTFQPMNQNTQ